LCFTAGISAPELSLDASVCVDLETTGNNHGALIFDAACGGPSDGTDNSGCTGGFGNAAPDTDLFQPFEGKVLILQNNNPIEYPSSLPNDDTHGGRFIFDFGTPSFKNNFRRVYLQSAVVMDIEEFPAKLKAQLADGSIVKAESVPGADGGIQTILIPADGVSTLNVTLKGSGALARLNLCLEEVSSTTTTSTTTSSISSTSTSSTTSTTTENDVAHNANYCPHSFQGSINDEADYCQVDGDFRSQCGNENIPRAACHALGCCWDEDAAGSTEEDAPPACFCPKSTTVTTTEVTEKYKEECKEEAQLLLSQIASINDDMVCAYLPLLQEGALAMSNKFAGKFAQAAAECDATSEHAADCGEDVNDVFVALFNRWKGLFPGDCQMEVGDLAETWADAAISWSYSFAMFGPGGGASAKPAALHFANAFDEIAQAVTSRAAEATCGQARPWKALLSTVIESGVKSSRAWANYAKFLPGQYASKTDIMEQWRNAFKTLADEMRNVFTTWADQCTTDLPGAKAGSEVSAMSLQLFSKNLATIVRDWTETMTTVGSCDGTVDTAGMSCLDYVRDASTLWSDMNFYTSFGSVAAVWGILFRDFYPGAGPDASLPWAEAFSAFSASVEKCSMAFAAVFRSSSASLSDKSEAAMDSSNMWATEAEELALAMLQAEDWFKVPDSSSSAAWSAVLNTMSNYMAQAAGSWSRVFSGTILETGLRGAGEKWAETLDEYVQTLSSLCGSGAFDGAGATSTMWGQVWKTIVMKSALVGTSFAQKFDPFSASTAAELNMVELRVRAVSGKFETLFENIANAIEECGTTPHAQASAGTPGSVALWLSAADSIEDTTDGTNPSSTACAFKSVLDHSQAPHVWTDDAGWLEVYSNVTGSMDGLRTAIGSP